mgnify:CR=1 FL=1
MKMFVFPHSGGFGYQYNFFRNYNFRDISEFYTYDYPRHLRENDGKPIEKNFSDRVNNAVSKLLEYGIKSGEYVLFGHSLGALVAYESGIKLQRDYGLSPATIIMSSQNPPVCFGKVKSWLTSMDLESTLIKLGGMNSDLTKERDAVKFYKRLLYEDLAIIDTYEPTIPLQNEMLKKAVKVTEQFNHEENYLLMRELMEPQMSNLFVTPKDIDEAVGRISYTISEAFNSLCHRL